MESDRRGHRAVGGSLDFWRHLEDLRKALFWSVLGWLLGTIIAWNYFQVALVAGSVISAPWVFWQFWRFLRPALRGQERKVALSAVWWTTFLFVVGLVAGYFTIFPMTLRWLAGYGGGMFEQMWTVDEYTSMSVKLLGGFAAMFEFPLLTWVLARLGIAGHREFLRWSRGAIVAIFVLAAVVTPPDPVSQCIMAVPMLALYFAGVGTAWLGRKR